MTDQKALKKLCNTLKFTFLTDKGNLEDFPLCGVVWVRCLSSLRRWLSPRPLSLGERLCRAESAHDSSFGRFSTKFRVQYNDSQGIRFYFMFTVRNRQFPLNYTKIWKELVEALISWPRVSIGPDNGGTSNPGSRSSSFSTVLVQVNNKWSTNDWAETVKTDQGITIIYITVSIFIALDVT